MSNQTDVLDRDCQAAVVALQREAVHAWRLVDSRQLGLQLWFEQEFHRLQNVSNQATHTNQSLKRWVALRLEQVASVAIVGFGFFLVIERCDGAADAVPRSCYRRRGRTAKGARWMGSYTIVCLPYGNPRNI